MTPWFQYLIVPLFAAILGSVLGPYLSAEFSLRRFRREQWWLEKRDAYESIIRALSEIMFDNHSEFIRLSSGGTLSLTKAPDREKQLKWNLQEIASGGAYIVSNKTVATISDLLNTLSLPGDGDASTFKDASEAAKRALSVIKDEAHRDLGLKK